MMSQTLGPEQIDEELGRYIDIRCHSDSGEESWKCDEPSEYLIYADETRRIRIDGLTSGQTRKVLETITELTDAEIALYGKEYAMSPGQLKRLQDIYIISIDGDRVVAYSNSDLWIVLGRIDCGLNECGYYISGLERPSFPL